MRVDAYVAARELNAVTTRATSELLGVCEQLRTNALTPKVTSHVHTLEFRARIPGVLEVREDNELTDARHLAVTLSDQHVTALVAYRENGAPVRVEVLWLLNFGAE